MLGEQRLVSNRQNADQSLSDILKSLNLSPADSRLSSSFSQDFEVREFQLGDELTTYSLSNQLENSVRNEQYSAGFYLICQGRVRLLGFDAAEGKEVSALVLEAGESFGTELLFTAIPSLTRAIAASEGQIAWMSIAQLQSWWEKLPQLREYLLSTALTRATPIFFKTSTDLRRLPVASLKQLLPYLVETQIPAGEALVQSSSSGHFWLCRGQISKGEQVSALAVGESWGYPDPTPDDWIAQTDLLAYKLPREHWEAAHNRMGISLEPQKSASVSVTSSNERLSRRSEAKLPRTIRVKSALPVQRHNAPNPQSSTSYSEPEGIAFPQPTRRRRWRRGLWQGYPFIQQQSSSDCGAACLAMIGRYWGKSFTLNYLRNLASVGRSGASLKTLANAAESLGFQARPVRASLRRIAEQSNPWIAHWQGDHYVVVYKIKGDPNNSKSGSLMIADPALGKRRLSIREFQDGWTGYGLLLDPTELLKAAPTQKNSLGNFLGVIWPYRSVVWQIILASLLIQLFGLITPLFTQIILDRVVVNKSFISLNVFAVGLLLFGIWRIGLTAIRQYLLDYFANRLDLTLIGGFISHTLSLPLKFFELRQVGDIITRVQENQKLQLFLTRKAVTAWLDAGMVFVYLGLMFYYNWQLTLLVLVLIPPLVILTVVASPFLRKVSRQIFNEEAGQNSSLVEMMTGISTVKAAAAERELRWRWEDRLTSTLNARFRGQKLGNALQATGGLINTLGSTALLWYGATLVIQDQLTIGQFVAFNMLIGNVINPILALVDLWDELQEVMVSVERLNDVFSATPEESPQKPLMILPRVHGEVKFDNVTFRYGQEEELNTLQNITFEVRSGQTVAIVGRSGSGKSTLVNLLQGLYHPSKGRLLIDGHDIRHVSPLSLRSQLGVMPQECFLFSGTILENITLYSDEFTLEQVVEVAKLAEAHHFIQDLPLGYNTKVGERGANLSGGQRQRIAIARALLGDPRILILDEATSSLDTESERRFQQNLARISHARTTFIIAHRLSTVRNADCILVLDRGILAEQGTHDELMEQRGIYFHLAQQQLDL
ncbi:MAG TPA: peptidase domain-containing ABC transporter [Candidatus Sericytochromatia bacterium]